MVVKVLRFLDVRLGVVEAWGRALAAEGAGKGRPFRVACGASLPLAGFPRPLCAAVDVQWFEDPDEAWANDAWLSAVEPELAAVGVGAPRVVAEEVVVRGADYLADRWAAGGERYKMLSFGKRNPRLTSAEFSARWRAEAGTVSGQTIPDEVVLGLAYVQNHPLPTGDGGEWPFDAVNEVWFERLDHLRRRGEHLRDRLAAAARQPATDSLMAPRGNGSIFVRELPITTSTKKVNAH